MTSQVNKRPDLAAADDTDDGGDGEIGFRTAKPAGRPIFAFAFSARSQRWRR